MAYDEGLEQRIDSILDQQPGLEAKKMFGGIGYLIDGNMACGIHKNRLVVRLGPDLYASASNRPDVVEFDITGRPMKGWIMVMPDGIAEDEELNQWIKKGINFAATLPPK